MKRPSFDSIFNPMNIKLLVALVYIGLCIYIGVLIYMKEAESNAIKSAPSEESDQSEEPEQSEEPAQSEEQAPSEEQTSSEGFRIFPARSPDGIKNPAYLPKVYPKENFTTDGLTDLERHYTYDNKIIPREYSLY